MRLMNGSLEHKNPWFLFTYRTYLRKISKAIEHAAERGQDTLVIERIPREFTHLIEKELENVGFAVLSGDDCKGGNWNWIRVEWSDEDE